MRKVNMKKFFILLTVSMTLLSGTLVADGLKNSLNSMMHTDDSTQMVNLSHLNLDAKPKRVHKTPKKRSSKAVVATINKHKIRKKEADAYLTQRTQGKIKNFDKLAPAQQLRLIKEFTLPILAYDMAKKELTAIEQETALTRGWMQKEARNIKVTVAEVNKVYENLKQDAVDRNDTRPVPPFADIRDRLHIQMVEKLMMDKLMKDIKIKILD